MTIDRDVIRHLEKLARIELDSDELETITGQLGRILEFVKVLQAVDTTDVAPTRLISHGGEAHLREDTVTPALDRDVVLEQAPDSADGHFRVPGVIDRGDPGGSA